MKKLGTKVFPLLLVLALVFAGMPVYAAQIGEPATAVAGEQGGGEPGEEVGIGEVAVAVTSGDAAVLSAEGEETPPEDEPETAATPQAKTITGFVVLEEDTANDINVAPGTPESEIPFPESITANVDGGEQIEIAVGEWVNIVGPYNPGTQRPYIYAPVRESLALPEGVSLPEDAELPRLRVVVGEVVIEAAPLATPVSDYAGLTAAIAAAPTNGTATEIEITGNITYPGSGTADEIVIAAGKNIVLSGTGTLTASTSRHFYVNGTNASLTLAQGNDVTLTGGNGTGGSFAAGGGSICVFNGGAFTMHDGLITDNSCATSSGGAVRVSQGSTFNLLGGAITNNEADSAGGVRLDESTFNMSGGEISGNSTLDGPAGGVGAGNESTVVLSGGVISGNEATYEGGGMVVETESSLTISGGSITGNKSDNFAGGVFFNPVYSTTTPFTMNGGTISDNEAPMNGGVDITKGIFIMNNGTISDNTATNGSAGGVFCSGTMTMEGGVISGNTADYPGNYAYGGGVHCGYNGAVTMNGGVIRDNIVSGGYTYGGGIHCNTGGVVTIAGGVISGNTISGTTAAYGGGVSAYASNDGTQLTMTSGVISGNTAKEGGGVSVQGGAPFNMSGGSIVDNTAENGGAIASAPDYSNLTISGDAVFSGNSASGGAYDYGIANRGSNGTGAYPSILWNGECSIAGTHLLNNYDVNYTSNPVSAIYTVTFHYLDADGGSLTATRYALNGEDVTPPTPPARQGYTFTGWDNSYTNITGDVTLTAQYAVLPSATIGNITVTGTVNSSLSGADTTKITLTDDTLKTGEVLNERGAAAWFTGAPAGVKVGAVGASGDVEIYLTFYDTPTTASTDAFDITIPGEFLTGGQPITVTANPNAKWNITGGGGGTDIPPNPNFTLVYDKATKSLYKNSVDAANLLNTPSTITIGTDGNLTFNGFHFSTTADTAVRLLGAGGVTIKLEGNNTITSTRTGDYGSSYGIDYRDGALSFEGSGQLTVTAGDVPSGSSIGIYDYSGNVLNIKSGTVTAITGTGTTARGIICFGINVTGTGTLIAQGNEVAIKADSEPNATAKGSADIGGPANQNLEWSAADEYYTIKDTTTPAKYVRLTPIGGVVVSVQPQPGVPAVSLPNQQALIDAAITPAEIAERVSNPGIGYELVLKVAPASADDVSEQKAQDEGHTVAAYYEITLEKEKFVGGVSQGVTMVTTLSGGIRIVIEIPAEFRAAGRSFAMVRNHGGTAEVLPDLDNDPNTLTFETDRFSPYALVYKDAEPPAPPPAPKPAQPGAPTPPTTATSPQTGVASPQTGDSSNVGLWLVLLAVAALGLAATLGARVLRRRTSENRDSV